MACPPPQVTFTLDGPAVFTLRASGTEPKLKWYLEVSSGSREARAGAGQGARPGAG